MRIFIASGIFHPDSGGPATYLYRLLPELQAQGHTVRALTYGEKTQAEAHYPYPLQRVSLKQPLLKRRREYLDAYRRELAQADLVYINSLGLPRSGDKHLPRVLKIVGDLAWERAVNKGWVAPDEDIDVFQRKRYNLLIKWLKTSRAHEARTVDQVIVPSHYLRELVMGWGAPAERIKVIYNALETQQYAPSVSQTEARASLGLQVNTPYLLTAARLTAWKGVDSLISALASNPTVELLIAGDGPLRGALQAQASQLGLSGRVHFLDKVPHERLALYMRAVDYFALYSGYEGLSHTILEALYAGTPVIASARGGNPEVVSDGLNGLLVTHPDVQALAEAIHSAFTPGMRDRLAANVSASSVQTLERFAWWTLVEQTLQTLSEVAARYGTRPAS